MAVVIANMIGTGVFTSLGFQVVEIQSVFVLMLLWITGGVLAFCGAVSYAELGAVMPRSGGEYHFLSSIYQATIIKCDYLLFFLSLLFAVLHTCSQCKL